MKNNSIVYIFNIVQNESIGSILIMLIAAVLITLDMFNKNSCRICGSNLISSALCKICKESVKWTCDKCDIIEEVKTFRFLLYNLDD